MSLFLLDTHLLLWGAADPARLPAEARALMEDGGNGLAFSVASIWEIAIKASLGRADFVVDPGSLRLTLLRRRFREFPITADHAVAAGALPWLHRDPFDRMLIAQAAVERVVLLTVDAAIGRYPGSIRHVV